MEIMMVPEQLFLNSHWEAFLYKLQSIVESPIKVKEIKKIIKITDKVFPSHQSILNHYRNKFSTETNQDKRSKWHNKDKQLLIWCVVKLHELDNRQHINPVNIFPFILDLQGLGLLVLGVGSEVEASKFEVVESPKNQPQGRTMVPRRKPASFVNCKVFKIYIPITSQTEFKKNWTTIAIEFNQNTKNGSTRYAKQIRERWNNYLDPNVKRDTWNTDERKQLFQLVNQLGKKWSQVSQLMDGRTENQVKNHYHSILKYLQKKISKNLTEKDIIDIVLDEQFTDLEQLVYSRKNLGLDFKKDGIKCDEPGDEQNEVEKKIKLNNLPSTSSLITEESIKIEQCINPEPNISKSYSDMLSNFFAPSFTTQMKQSPSQAPIMSPQMMLMLSPQMMNHNSMIYNPYVIHNRPQDNIQAIKKVDTQPHRCDYKMISSSQQEGYARQMQNMQQHFIALQNLTMSTPLTPVFNSRQVMSIPQVNVAPPPPQPVTINPAQNTPKTPNITTPVTAIIGQCQALQQMSMDNKKIDIQVSKTTYHRNLKVLQIQSSLQQSLQ